MFVGLSKECRLVFSLSRDFALTRVCALCVGGGGGGLHACMTVERLGPRRCVC